ncbi:MAG: trypsin-like peptidase domain-containing protein [Victivallales bacterium]|nr:trypsin-like peptidase domain-containing protein [Victivallales bacterium]
MHLRILFLDSIFVAFLLWGNSCVSTRSNLENDFQKAVHVAKEQVYPALVYIRVVQRSLERGQEELQTVRGSGVIISADGEVLTNHHVVENAQEIRCQLNDGQNLTAELVGSDKDLDVALLKLQLPDGLGAVPSAHLRPTGCVEGDFVMALGAPMGLTRTVTVGIISCARRVIPGQGTLYNTWYQMDAAIFPGNSGGPLVDINGDVIGLNTLGLAGKGMGFALPSFVILDILPRLREYKSVNWAWFGFQFQPLHDFEKNTYFPFSDGIMIADTDTGSPARLGGIQSSDRLLAYNGHRVTAVNQEDIPDVARQLAMLPLDQPSEFLLERNGQQFSVLLQPGDKGKAELTEREFPRWGFSAKEINRFEQPTLHFYAPDGGVFVFGISDEYRGRMELKRNDIIVSVNGEEIHTLEELQTVYGRCLETETIGKKLTVAVIRSGRRMQQIITLLGEDANNEEDYE